MYDHQTESLWSQILGQAISGEFQGAQLTFIPALQTSWQNWKTMHPDTLVVSPALFGSDSYTSYYISGREGVVGRGPFGGGPDRGDTIRAKEQVVGVRLAGEARAYPFSVLSQEPVINDQIGQFPVAVFFDKSVVTAAVFDRRLSGGATLTFEALENPGLARDTQTETEWDVLTGIALNGLLAGTQLEQVPITYAFWFGWIDYHPESTVYGLER